jgi:hypothetical protein
MVLTVTTPHGGLLFSPSADRTGHVVWTCHPAEGLKPTQAPPACRGGHP